MNVSILIPAYGGPEWRELAWSRAYPSALEQQAVEVLVEYQPDGTIASARNALAEQARGDWLCFLDADDELRTGYLRHMRETHDPEALDVLYAPSIAYVRNGKAQKPMFWPESDLRETNWLVIGTLVSRDLFMRVGGFREGEPHGLEDWSLWARCYQAGAFAVKVPRAVYVAHHNSRSKHHTLMADRASYMVEYEKVRCNLWG